MLQLMLSWPPGHQVATLDETVSRAYPLWFDAITGRFSADRPSQPAPVLQFYFLGAEALVSLVSKESGALRCLLDGQPLIAGHPTSLTASSVLQAGCFRLEVMSVKEQALFSGSNSYDHYHDEAPPELDDLIGQSGYYTPWLLPDTVCVAGEELNNDILKQLAQEYKRYLTWGDLRRSYTVNSDANKQELRLKTMDCLPEIVSDDIKSRTLTECILNKSALMDKVMAELMSIQLQEWPDDNKVTELLLALAPEQSVRVKKRTLSELIQREQHKPGLGSKI